LWEIRVAAYVNILLSQHLRGEAEENHRKAPASKSEIKTWASTEPIRAVKLLLKFEIGCFPLICNNPGACSPDWDLFVLLLSLSRPFAGQCLKL